MASAYPAIHIVWLALMASLSVEFLCWFFVYRTSGYKNTKNGIEKAVKKLDEYEAIPNKDKKTSKEQKRQLDVVKGKSKELFYIKSKVLVITGGLFLLTYKYITASYKGFPVAKLPFEPPGFISRLSHAGLSDEDYTNCSCTFIYVLCSAGLRPNFAKIFGFGLPASMSKYGGGTMESLLSGAKKTA